MKNIIRKLTHRRYHLSTITAVKIFSGSATVLVALVVILLLTAAGKFKQHVESYNSSYVKTIVRLLEKSIDHDLTFLKNEANRTTLVKASMDPDNSRYYLPDYMNHISFEEYSALFTLITFDGMIIYSTNSNNRANDFIDRFDEWVGESEVDKHVHIYNDKRLCFTTAVYYNNNIEGYLLTEVELSSILAQKLSYIQLEEQQMNISAYKEESLLASLGPVSTNGISSHHYMSSLPVDIKVTVNRETVDRPISQMQSRMLIQGVIAILLSTIGLTFFLSRNLIKPIVRLRAAVVNIAHGGWEEVFETRRSSIELEELRVAFNKMQSSLRKRTLELESSNSELSLTNSRLKSTQQKLIQSEKLASVGQLAAGVAHEINNPTAFVMSNISTLTGYINTFKKVISTLDELKEALNKRDDNQSRLLLERLEKIEEEDYLAFIMEDTDTLLKESLDGTVRIKEIVKGLRVFAHSDNETRAEENINEAIEAALNIVLNRVKYCCDIEKVLEPLPLYSCNLNQITQVFVNLLVNAADAISENGLIRLHSRAEDGRILVEVSDNGSGIPTELLSKLFDPFFTTKEVGRGTGLGLSISQGILEKHGASIDVESKTGEGTTFSIIFPLTEKRDTQNS